MFYYWIPLKCSISISKKRTSKTHAETNSGDGPSKEFVTPVYLGKLKNSLLLKVLLSINYNMKKTIPYSSTHFVYLVSADLRTKFWLPASVLIISSFFEVIKIPFCQFILSMLKYQWLIGAHNFQFNGPEISNIPNSNKIVRNLIYNEWVG